LGRSNVIHAALLAGYESETFLVRAARLGHFRTGPMPGLPDTGKAQIRKSAKADARQVRQPAKAAGMTKHGETPENRDRNG